MAEDIYDHLGVARLVNAAGGFTAYGGSRMRESTLKRMNEAARSYTDIRALQAAVHGRLAKLTRNEAAFVSNGADTGLYLCAAAAVERRAGRPIRYLSPEEIGAYEVIVFTAHHNPYDFVLQQLGVRTKTLGYANFIEPITREALTHNITDRTAAIFFFQAEHGWTTQGGLPFEDTVAVARMHGLPLVIDCAAQLPPKENLWRFTQAGATAALFSGGKDLRGPQSSGLLVGERWFLEIVTRIGFPNYGHGRMMKTGREEIVGLYWAVKEYLEADEDARLPGPRRPRRRSAARWPAAGSSRPSAIRTARRDSRAPAPGCGCSAGSASSRCSTTCVARTRRWSAAARRPAR